MTGTAYILTHFAVPNFGANLQAWATARALSSRGFSPHFVDFRPEELEQKYAKSVSEAQRAAHTAFVAEHLTVTAPVASQEAFEALCASAPADLYLTGSDAVFRLAPDSRREDLRFPNPYWLVGAAGVDGAAACKVSVAPSAMGCALSEFPESTRQKMRAALDDFAHVSARDSWTAGQIAAIGYKGAVTEVPDPVFSLAPVLRGLRDKRASGRPYIALCTQGRKPRAWVEAFTRKAAAAGYDTLALPTPEGRLDEGTTRRANLPLSPLDWAALIAGAEGYVGGRFHPVVISLATGNAAVALDLYHRHPFERARSKTWQIMRRFNTSQACHSRAMHRFLTPGMVWAQLRGQMRNRAARLRTADLLAAEVTAWYDRVCDTSRPDAS